MSNTTATTAYQVGYEFAEESLADASVDVDEMLGHTNDVPDGDYCWMVDNGVEPNAREYWRGYNAAVAARI